LGGGGDTVLVSNAGTLTLAGNVTNSYRWSNRSLRLAGSGNGVISGIISDGVYVTSVTKSGTGTWTLSGANIFSGGITISTGMLMVGNNDAIPNGNNRGDMVVDGTLDIAGYLININGLSGRGIVDNTVGAGNITVGNNNASSTFGGVIKNTGGMLALTKTGTGTLTLSGNNTFTGDVTVPSGSLRITNSNALGAGTKTIWVCEGTSGNSQFHLDGGSGNITLPSSIAFYTSNQVSGTIFNDAGNNTINGTVNLWGGAATRFLFLMPEH